MVTTITDAHFFLLLLSNAQPTRGGEGNYYFHLPFLTVAAISAMRRRRGVAPLLR